jgi:hypothetical protein
VRSIADSTRSSTYACEINPPLNPAITAALRPRRDQLAVGRLDRNRRRDAAKRAIERRVDAISSGSACGGVGVGTAIEERSLITRRALALQARADRFDAAHERRTTAVMLQKVLTPGTGRGRQSAAASNEGVQELCGIERATLAALHQRETPPR